MASLDNVPRKEKQFRNFASNSLKLHKHDSDRLLSEIWKFVMDLKESQRKEQQEEKEQQQQQQTKDAVKVQKLAVSEGSVDEKPQREVDLPQTDASRATSDDSLTAKAVKRAMKRVLKQSKDHSLPVKQIRKALKKELGLVKGDKERLKELIQVNASKKTFSLDGKVIRLQAL